MRIIRYVSTNPPSSNNYVYNFYMKSTDEFNFQKT